MSAAIRFFQPKVTPKLLNDDWIKFKELTLAAIQQNNFTEAFRLLEGMGYFGYRYNFIPTYADDEVEQLIVDLSLKITAPVSRSAVSPGRIVFYDFFVLENRGFTQQYLNVIIKNNFELLYIVEDSKKYKEDNAIIKKVNDYEKGSVLILPSALSKVEKLKYLLNEIEKFAPSKIFIHNSPWDILSCCFSFLLQESGIKTYLLNITDHTYWPGKRCFSYFIDFRQYGAQVNKELRKIPASQLILIPTPSFNDAADHIPFKGFPVNTESKVVGFSGGASYKIRDEKNTFLNLIKETIRQNPDFIFLFANVDGDNELNRFIKKHKLEQRFILIGNRIDINEVFKRIDIYFNTFPYGGGLMIQHALANRKPILALCDEEMLVTRIDKVIDRALDEKYIIKNKNIYLTTAKKLIQDKDFRGLYAEGLYINTGKEFEDNLSALLSDSLAKQINDYEPLLVNTKAMTDFHITSDRLYLNEYPNLANQYLSKNYRIRPKGKFSYMLFIGRFLRWCIPVRVKSALIKMVGSFVIKAAQQKKSIEYKNLKNKFKSFGENSTLPEERIIINPQFISIGNNFSALHNLRLEALDQYQHQSFTPALIIGNNVTLNPYCHIGCIDKVIIGNNVLVASKVYISDHSHGDITTEALKLPPSERPLISKGPVIIEDNVWIGENVCIFPNVTIGKNSIIGANSLVNRSIPNNSVVAGTPARAIKQL